MAPEIFKKGEFFESGVGNFWISDSSFVVGHGKPVDIWAVGVIAYFLLCGELDFASLQNDCC